MLHTHKIFIRSSIPKRQVLLIASFLILFCKPHIPFSYMSDTPWPSPDCAQDMSLPVPVLQASASGILALSLAAYIFPQSVYAPWRIISHSPPTLKSRRPHRKPLSPADTPYAPALYNNTTESAHSPRGPDIRYQTPLTPKVSCHRNRPGDKAHCDNSQSHPS